jgi:hypothetical protein
LVRLGNRLKLARRLRLTLDNDHTELTERIADEGPLLIMTERSTAEQDD